MHIPIPLGCPSFGDELPFGQSQKRRASRSLLVTIIFRPLISFQLGRKVLGGGKPCPLKRVRNK
ncbi:MAG: hypothetical protein C0407_12740 [Desulfobacca sp.]|nr:hypothetical protein [Desulfobacca sp.]